ncbi:CoA-disulfide reductase [Solibacillus sp. R5-41]|uniref:FAD-dependent oxidoreductase n=1 Tax=Solibacillus sp. R5-41 TaxID=2048654 RepID=UPI000C127820|nr:FAD-dependent oxidoreductase [Solibacillus sp. R5-41]ATP38713.1 CoA-disulfide reductase [Solibacillus sp. R5-41]
MKVVIIGGDAAGMSAAMEIYRNHKAAEILVLERSDIYSYGQCGLPYVINGKVTHTDELIARDVEVYRGKYGMDARIFHEVTAIDTQTQIVYATDVNSGEAFEFSYDQLLIATGATPTMPTWENQELQGIHQVKTIPEMAALMQDLAGTKHVTVIGAGYIGLEIAETVRERGINVRIIHRGSQLMSTLDPELAKLVLEEAIKNGIEVLLEEEIIGFEGQQNIQGVRTEKGSYATDLVIVATGVKPNTQFANGFAKLPNGALIVNEKMETSIPNVYAAGDCASHYHRVKQKDDYSPLGTTANKQGRIAGLNIAGLEHSFQGIVGTSILKFFNLQIGMTGLTNEAADDLNHVVEVYRYEANDVASYYQPVRPMKIRMLVEQQSRQLLGMQAVGGSGVDKRIDVFATALYNGMTFERLLDLDLAYAPPFNGVWDAIQQAPKRYGKM